MAIVPRGEIDPEVMAKIDGTLKEVISGIEDYEFKKAVDSIMALADFGNIYFQAHEPWKLIKNDKDKAGSVLRSCLQIAKALVILMEPVMPSKMDAAWRQLGMDGISKAANSMRFSHQLRKAMPWAHLKYFLARWKTRQSKNWIKSSRKG